MRRERIDDRKGSDAPRGRADATGSREGERAFGESLWFTALAREAHRLRERRTMRAKL
jgi:hypothetical protein